MTGHGRDVIQIDLGRLNLGVCRIDKPARHFDKIRITQPEGTIRKGQLHRLRHQMHPAAGAQMAHGKRLHDL